MTDRELDQAAMKAIKDEARREALEECCRWMCEYCEDEVPTETLGDGRIVHPWDSPDYLWARCRAEEIRKHMATEAPK